MSKNPEQAGATALTSLHEGLLIAFDAMRANALRSSLTILGVAVGVSVVVMLAALITGIRTSVMEAFEAGPTNGFMVMRFDFTAVRISDGGNNRPPWWNKPELVPAEAERLDRMPTIDAALFNFAFSIDMDYDGHTVRNIQTQGYSSGWPAYQPGTFIAGRDFTPAEVDQNRAVVVITSELATELFGQRDPIGRRVRMLNRWRGTQEPFRVVGVIEPADNIFSGAVPHFAVVPYTAAVRRLRQNAEQASIYVVPKDSVTFDRAQDDVIAAMREIRGLGPREENDFATMASAQIIDLFDQLTAVFFLVMMALSSTGLLVGGVGVIGIMLISVTERTREIGIRKAVGATRREILWQFLVEASAMTALGALVGMLMGWGLAAIVAALTPVPARIPLWAVGTALAMASLTGMLFGLLPAMRASRMDPVDALRFE
ncbi:MAG TPA: ABC transporter permease [Gemmatimonadetes bacterium]|nr:ABC transporter permease [Gemmatimonadota bacterium]